MTSSRLPNFWAPASPPIRATLTRCKCFTKPSAVRTVCWSRRCSQKWSSRISVLCGPAALGTERPATEHLRYVDFQEGPHHFIVKIGVRRPGLAFINSLAGGYFSNIVERINLLPTFSSRSIEQIFASSNAYLSIFSAFSRIFLPNFFASWPISAIAPSGRPSHHPVPIFRRNGQRQPASLFVLRAASGLFCTLKTYQHTGQVH